ILLLGMHRQHEHAQRGAFFLDPLHQFYAAATGHGQVEQQDFKAARANRGNHFVGVARLAGHDKRRIGGQDAAQALAHDGVIVRDEDSGRHAPSPPVAAGIGRRARTVVPPSWLRSTFNVPPSSNTRSRMPRSPNDPGFARASGFIPTPLSATVSTASPSSHLSRTTTWLACAWRATLVSDSCMTRNRVEACGSPTSAQDEPMSSLKVIPALCANPSSSHSAAALRPRSSSTRGRRSLAILRVVATVESSSLFMAAA